MGWGLQSYFGFQCRNQKFNILSSVLASVEGRLLLSWAIHWAAVPRTSCPGDVNYKSEWEHAFEHCYMVSFHLSSSVVSTPFSSLLMFETCSLLPSLIIFSFFLLGWDAGSTGEPLHCPRQGLWKSLQNSHQKRWTGTRVLQIKIGTAGPKLGLVVSVLGLEGRAVFFMCFW